MDDVRFKGVPLLPPAPAIGNIYFSAFFFLSGPLYFHNKFQSPEHRKPGPFQFIYVVFLESTRATPQRRIFLMLSYILFSLPEIPFPVSSGYSLSFKMLSLPLWSLLNILHWVKKNPLWYAPSILYLAISKHLSQCNVMMCFLHMGMICLRVSVLKFLFIFTSDA